MSAFKEIGDAIVAQLNARAYDLEFVARYATRFNVETDITNDFQVVVQPHTKAKERLDRVTWRDTFTHAVMVAQKISVPADQLEYQKELQLSTMDEIEDQLARVGKHGYAGFAVLTLVSDITGRACFNEDLYMRGVFAAATMVTTSGQTETC